MQAWLMLKIEGILKVLIAIAIYIYLMVVHTYYFELIALLVKRSCNIYEFCYNLYNIYYIHI